MAEKKKIYLQPTPVRIWHWINALGIITLIVSGIQIRFPEYFPLFGSYESAIHLHNTAGYVVIVSLCFWFIYYVFIARTMVKLYVPTNEDIKTGIVKQAKFYFLTYFLGWENPHHLTADNKFNAMQKLAYLAVMFGMMSLVCLTGLLLTNVEPLGGLIAMVGGLKIVVGVHFLMACCLAAFLPTHVYLATLGHTPMAHIKTMWTGWEEVEEEE